MSEPLSIIILIILYLANFAFLLRFLSAIATKTVFKGIEAVYSIILLILIYGTINYFNFILFLTTLISALIIFGIITVNANKFGMRIDNNNSKKSILISVIGLVIVFFSSLFIYSNFF